MTMRAAVAMVLAGAMAVAVGQRAWADEEAAKAPVPQEKQAAVAKAAYVCPDCHTMAMEAGKCEKCGKDMKAMHVLGTKDGNAMLCQCGAGCKCDTSKVKDGKCGCGKDVVTVSAKGLYVCPDGCPDISDKPGKCMCGKDTVKVE